MKTDRWPLPRIEEAFDDRRGSKLFATLDLFCGYRQRGATDSCKEMATFTTCFGTYQFEIMLFCLMNARSTFQSMMDVVIQGLLFARVHRDDVVILSKLRKKHSDYL